ncbi:MAG: ribonuclease R [Alphaproteobacteria bacterium]|nr:MAG: ribonuclease R [Alphaproteobacteria bacterium]
MKSFPDKTAILAWVRDNPDMASKRDIARAFGIKGADRVALKEMLRELQEEGLLSGDRKAYRDPASLPPVAVLVVRGTDHEGDLFAKPQYWEGAGAPPRVLMVGRGPALGPGDRVLARISRHRGDDGFAWEGRTIRRIGTGPALVLGIFREAGRGGRVEPIERGARRDWIVAPGETAGARPGELVEAERAGPGGRVQVLRRLGDPSEPRAISLIAIHAHGLPVAFSDAALAEADAAQPVTLEDRADLRHLPLLTIDPEDARDHDDAVAALPDPDPSNPGGWQIWVAIADVAHYVRPGSALDRDARERGNSTYFADRVVPMLPEALSGDLCSLHEGADRPCIALELTVDREGNTRGQRFHRALMRSVASLTYAQAQAAFDGRPDAVTEPLMEGALAPLLGAYRALAAARERRRPLDLDLPEREIRLSETGEVVSVGFRDRLEAHRLIEEFMIRANVAAAEILQLKRVPLIYRVHEVPPPEKLDTLREIAEGAGLALSRGQVITTAVFNRLLEQASGTDVAEIVHMAVLRAQTQAYYSPDPLGHFGLNLRAYAHFTSPIRRYADLVLHRALIRAHGWGDDGLSEAEIDTLAATAEHISMTERRSMDAERDTADRYLAAFLKDRVGASFSARVSGVSRAGVFARLDETGADGFIPVSTLGMEYFRHDPDRQTLTGVESGTVFKLGLRLQVRLAEAEPITGGLLLQIERIEDRPAKGGARRPLHRKRPEPGRRRPVRRRARRD